MRRKRMTNVTVNFSFESFVLVLIKSEIVTGFSNLIPTQSVKIELLNLRIFFFLLGIVAESLFSFVTTWLFFNKQ